MQKIGRYEILEELGRGSMGVVFKARDPQIGRTVAIKIILTANLPREESELFRTRFFREAQAAGQMSHPGIVTIHDIAEDESGQPYLVMEFVEGPTLHKMLRPDPHGKIKERFPIERTLDICAQVAEALEYAHRRGVVHRDVKPSNIMVTSEGRAKIADFGIARLSGTEATHTATVTGTPAYMSPEQFRGGTIDSRSDIFSLGSMLYWMATGEKAFPGENVTQVSFNVVYREPAPPRHIAPHLPPDVEVVLSRCLAKRPENRYATAGEAAVDLRAILEGKKVTTTSAPAETTVEDTVVTMQSVTPVGIPLSSSASAITETAELVRKNQTPLLILSTVFVLAAGVWFWQRSKDATQTQLPSITAASNGPAAAAQNPPSGRATNPGAATPGAHGAPQPATSAAQNSLAPLNSSAAPRKSALGTGASIALDCRHNFKEAALEIQADGQILVKAKLEGKPSGALGRVGGVFAQTFSLRPGKHTISVHVLSEADKYIERETIEGEFPEGTTQTLEIRFGRAVFGRNRNLTLKWKKD